MSLLPRSLMVLHPLSALALLSIAVTGYIAPGRESDLFVLHIQAGFFTGLLAGFTHAMTLFYFAGMGVGMRQASKGRGGFQETLEHASEIRRRMAPLLGAALVSVMAAVILGGGSHTGMTARWPHEMLALAALGLNLLLAYRAPGWIRRYEGLARHLEAGLNR